MRSEVTVIFQSSPPVRQWVLSVPKRLRYFLQRDGAALNTALRIFLRVVQHNQEAHCPGDRAMCQFIESPLKPGERPATTTLPTVVAADRT